MARVTTSSTLAMTYQFLQRTEAWQVNPWSVVILDEAQAIKNPGSASTKAVKRLQAPTRIALTGTPVENRPGDLWSLFGCAGRGREANAGTGGGGHQYGLALDQPVACYILR